MLDQAIKLIIKAYYFESQFVIIGGFVNFKPVINRQLSYLTSLLDVTPGVLPAVLINTLILYIFIQGYRFYMYKFSGVDNKIALLIFLLYFSEGLCSLIDKAFWGGSLDYIQLEKFFIFDLKDCYISAASVLLLICVFRNHKAMNDIKTGEFLRFLLNK